MRYLVLILMLSGCCGQREHIIEEAVILLRNPCPGGPEWERRRVTFLEDAARAH